MVLNDCYTDKVKTITVILYLAMSTSSMIAEIGYFSKFSIEVFYIIEERIFALHFTKFLFIYNTFRTSNFNVRLTPLSFVVECSSHGMNSSHIKTNKCKHLHTTPRTKQTN